MWIIHQTHHVGYCFLFAQNKIIEFEPHTAVDRSGIVSLLVTDDNRSFPVVLVSRQRYAGLRTFCYFLHAQFHQHGTHSFNYSDDKVLRYKFVADGLSARYKGPQLAS